MINKLLNFKDSQNKTISALCNIYKIDKESFLKNKKYHSDIKSNQLNNVYFF